MLNAIVEIKTEGVIFNMPLMASDTERRQAEAWLQSQFDRASRNNEQFPVNGMLTPVLAQLLLELNPDNRKPSKTHAAKLAKDIVAGAWMGNGQTVTLSMCRKLNDGQHRCLAVIMAGIAIPVTFQFGYARESRLTCDQGKIKTVRDKLSMEGVGESGVAAAAAGLIFQYLDRGAISASEWHRPTQAEVLELALGNVSLESSIKAVPPKGTSLLGGRSVIVFAHYVLSLADREAADHFIAKLLRGDGLVHDHPIFACRERLMNSRRLTVAEKAELIFRAWNAFRDGRPISKFPIFGTLPKLRG